MTEVTPPAQQPTPEELKAQKSRNRWLALALVVFVALVGITTSLRIRESTQDVCNKLYLSGGVRDLQEEERCRKQQATSPETIEVEEGQVSE